MRKLISLIVMGLFSTQVLAIDLGGFFIEPIVTYERGKGDVDFPGVGSAEVKVEGFGAGARVGFHLLESLFIGADGRFSYPRFNDDLFNLKTRATSWNYGPVVGVQMPFLVGLRGWAGWIMGGELDPEKEGGANAQFNSANGYRLGGGLKIGWASLNVEYQSITYDEVDVLGNVLPPSESMDDVEFKNGSWVLSVSYPLSL